MSKSKHAAAVGVEAGQQGRPAGRTGGRSTEGFPKENAFLREALQIRGRYRLAVRREVSPGIMRMDVDDIRTEAGRRIDLSAGVSSLQGNPGYDHALEKRTPRYAGTLVRVCHHCPNRLLRS